MLVRIAVALSAVAFAVPALAEPMSAEAARRFVAGKQFSFTCFEGTVGSGRIFSDGSLPACCASRAPARCVSCACRRARCSPEGESVCRR